MATIQESSIFEYCESVYDELKKKDNGYYPSRHDKVVFERASSHFSMSQNEVERIYSDYTKQIAEIEMRKIKKLPLKKQQKAMADKFRDILCNNKDLPYYKTESGTYNELKSHSDIFQEEYNKMVVSISKQGWTIPLDIDIKHFDKLKECYTDSELLNDFFVDYYVKGKFNLMCRKIKKSFTNQANIVSFDECLEAFNSGMYNISITSLITLFESLLSEFGDNKNDVRMMRICKFNCDEEINKGNKIKSLCWNSMYEFVQVVYQKSDFSSDEPLEINRHWIEHGRTEKIYKKSDCLKVINALSTLTIIKQNDTDVLI